MKQSGNARALQSVSQLTTYSIRMSITNNPFRVCNLILRTITHSWHNRQLVWLVLDECDILHQLGRGTKPPIYGGWYLPNHDMFFPGKQLIGWKQYREVMVVYLGQSGQYHGAVTFGCYNLTNDIRVKVGPMCLGGH